MGKPAGIDKWEREKHIVTAKYQNNGNSQSSLIVVVKQASGTYIVRCKKKDKCAMQK